MTNSREKFEAWLKEISEPEEIVNDSTTRLMWHSWLAGRESMRAEADEACSEWLLEDSCVREKIRSIEP